ncbi:peptidase inhibitor family I36 protein [Streptomyces sp. NPDC017940]|uniref:peptidase inhibitor family I36 protein n=1 Tax=Streptomyces sp. NPDC017940 TaxID=3365017 RepID=UPI0037A9BA4C
MFVVWPHPDFGGQPRCFEGNDPDLRNIGWDDSVSSMQNNTGHAVKMYPHANYTGTPYLAKAHSEDKSLINNNFDDSASSILFWA